MDVGAVRLARVLVSVVVRAVNDQAPEDMPGAGFYCQFTATGSETAPHNGHTMTTEWGSNS